MDNKVIIYKNAKGGVSIFTPAPGCTEAEAVRTVPFVELFEPTGETYEEDGEAHPVMRSLGHVQAEYSIVCASTLPQEKVFRDAWVCEAEVVRINLDKAKCICHDLRRAKRTAEFAPLDLLATIPTKAADAEAGRQAVRDRYEEMQVAIDSAADVAALTEIVELHKLARV